MKRFFVFAVLGIAVAPLPVRAETIYGLTNLQTIVTFDSATRTVTNFTGVSGFGITGEILVSIDVRPNTGELYGLSSQNKLYKINPMNGANSLVGSGLGVTLTGNVKSIDFNPTVDRVRIVTSSGQDFRAHPDTGAVVFTDPMLAFKTGDPNFGDVPSVVSAAYTNSFPGASSTTLYEIEAGNNILVTQIPPNDGVLNTIAPLGFDVVDSGGFTGFDISGSTKTAYLTSNSFFGGGLTANSLYTINLMTGATTLVGPVSGVNGTLRDIAVANAPIPEPATGLLAVLALCSSVAIRRRHQTAPA